MNIQEIKEAFPDSEIKDGDAGKYIDIDLNFGVYLYVFEKDNLSPDLEVHGKFASMPFVKSIDDIRILYQLFNGET